MNAIFIVIIKIKVERTKDGYSTYADNVEGIYEGGEILIELKQSILTSILLLKDYNSEDNIADILKRDYEIDYIKFLKLVIYIDYFTYKWNFVLSLHP